MAVVVWLLLWRTRLGYAIRAFGKSEAAARYAGISPFMIVMVAMLMSGALAGMMAINNVMGEAERLLQNSASGAGFIGIAVALMGRNHPVGVVLAALLFGFLFQGGAELGLWTKIPIEMRIVVQGLVILFTGALDMMVRMMLTWVFNALRAGRTARGAACWITRRFCRSSTARCVWRRPCCSPVWRGFTPNGQGSSTSGWKARC